jgi:hypothetical protein
MWNTWKAALLEVFNDESTLSTHMGAWFDVPVHQESEWWMNVWEWCIYQQTNGEWSQYADHTFSRLRFSITPMPVPHPGQCSHRIQVTQHKTLNLKVTAKVDVVTSQDTVPTVLNSYTSSIGLSFLSLPWHIQNTVTSQHYQHHCYLD